MPSKEFKLDGGLAVTVYKRRANRNLRLSITPSGQVRVSIPAWASYQAGLNFAKSRAAWIADQYQPVPALVQGQAIGKGHHLHFRAKAGLARPASRVHSTDIVVYHAVTDRSSDLHIQRVAQEACIRALRKQAEQLLPKRLATLAEPHGFQYTEVRVKALKSRWGSCDQHGRIVFNLYLMQLRWELIDYVLFHELTHTRVLRHGPEFWQALERVSPGAKGLKKQLQAYQPILIGS